jgi:hypothetical protein
MYCETYEVAPAGGGCGCRTPETSPANAGPVSVLELVEHGPESRGAPWWLVVALLALALGGR